MHRIPVFATIANAYRFVVRDFGTIVRLSWFLLLIAILLQYFATRALYQHVIDAVSEQRVLELLAFSVLQYGALFVQGMVASIVAVALHRVILFGDRKPGRMIYLAFGKIEGIFLLLPFLIVISLFLLAGSLGILLAAFLAFGGAVLFGSPQNSIAPMVGPLLGAGLGLFVGTRLTLLFPLAVAERRIVLREGWRLGRGNFWRLLGVFVLGVLPPLVVIGFVTVLLNPAPVSENASAQEVLRYFEEMSDALPMQTVFNLVAAVIVGALGVGLLCYAFKAASGDAPDDLLIDYRPVAEPRLAKAAY
jgi:hypothetical protein